MKTQEETTQGPLALPSPLDLVYTAVGRFTTDWPLFMTLSVIVLVPMVVFFVLAQRQIVSGLVSGNAKG